MRSANPSQRTNVEHRSRAQSPDFSVAETRASTTMGLITVIALSGCASSNVRSRVVAESHDRLAATAPGSSNQRTASTVTTTTSPPCPCSATSDSSRAAPRLHLVVGGYLLSTRGAMPSDLMPLPGVTVDVGVQLHDRFALYWMFRATAMWDQFRGATGPAVEWTPSDYFSLSLGMNALALARVSNYGGVNAAFSAPLGLHFSGRQRGRTELERQSFRVSLEGGPSLYFNYGSWSLGFVAGVGFSYARH